MCSGGARQSTSPKQSSTLTTCSRACPRHLRREPLSRPFRSRLPALEPRSPRRPSRLSHRSRSSTGHLWCPESSSGPRENAAFFLSVDIVGGNLRGVHTSKQIRSEEHTSEI